MHFWLNLTSDFFTGWLYPCFPLIRGLYNFQVRYHDLTISLVLVTSHMLCITSCIIFWLCSYIFSLMHLINVIILSLLVDKHNHTPQVSHFHTCNQKKYYPVATGSLMLLVIILPIISDLWYNALAKFDQIPFLVLNVKNPMMIVVLLAQLRSRQQWMLPPAMRITPKAT